MECLRLGPNNVSIQFMMSFFADAEISNSLPDDDRTLCASYRAAQALEGGSVLAYAPVLNGKAIGLFWGKFMNDKCIEANWGIFKEFRGRGTAKEAMQAVIDMVKEDFPMVTSVIGTISKHNIRSYAGAVSCGFTSEGTLPKNHIHNGKVYDSWIVVKEI